MKPSDSFYLSIWETAHRAPLEREKKKYSESRERLGRTKTALDFDPTQPSTINLTLTHLGKTRAPISSALVLTHDITQDIITPLLCF